MKKAIRILSLALCVLLVAGIMVSCTGTGESSEPASTAGTSSSEPEQGLIGFSVYTMAYEFFQSMEKGTKAEVEALGYTYELHDEKEDATEMVSGATALINKGVQALIISPFKPDGLSPIIEAAKAKNIPVVIDDIGGGGTDYNVIVISDCYKGGQMAADYTDELLKAAGVEGKEVAIIKCEESAVYAIRRGEGYKDRMTELGYTVLDPVTANSKGDEALTAMTSLLASNPNIVAVFAENDPMAVGASQAIKTAGKTDKIVLIGFNGDPEAIEAMTAGTMQGTIAQDPEGMGKLTAQLADKLIKGETLTFGNETEREIYAEVTLLKGSEYKA